MAEAWSAWHAEYEAPQSALAIRLAIVQHETRKAISRCSARTVHLVSVCAGQGRDVIEAVAGHPRQADVTAVLLEIESENVAAARRRVSEAGLANVVVVQVDASLTDAYARYVPVDVLLVCGVFGHVSDGDIQHTIDHLPHLCRPGASVIWTRHLGPRDGSANLTPTIRDWFREAGFEELAFEYTAQGYGVGAHQLVAPAKPYEPGRRLFTFSDRSP